MRSRNSVTVSDRQVQMLAEDWLRTAMPLRDVGWKCTSRRLWQIVLLAAARMSSVFAVCRDLVGAPCDQAVRNALTACLPARPLTLEQWLHPALCGPQLPGAIFRKARQVAIDWHLIPYHGQPHRHANELYHSLPRSGTSKFHAYATACVVEQGYRYTLAATSVKGSESPLAVLERLLDRLQARGLKIKVLLLDRQFFSRPVLERLQQRRIPFLMPVARAAAGRSVGRDAAQSRAYGSCEISCAVPPDAIATRGRSNRVRPPSPWWWRTRAIATTKPGSAARAPAVRSLERERAPVELRELYRRRFGIESSYRQLGQARIRTCTTDPVQRLFFVLVGLVLRNVWVWLHFTYFAELRNGELVLHLERLRFRRMLHWIANAITRELHDGSSFSTQLQLE